MPRRLSNFKTWSTQSDKAPHRYRPSTQDFPALRKVKKCRWIVWFHPAGFFYTILLHPAVRIPQYCNDNKFRWVAMRHQNFCQSSFRSNGEIKAVSVIVPDSIMSLATSAILRIFSCLSWSLNPKSRTNHVWHCHRPEQRYGNLIDATFLQPHAPASIYQHPTNRWTINSRFMTI